MGQDNGQHRRRGTSTSARRAAGIALLMGATLAGCSGSPSSPSTPSRAEALWSSRTPYVGDNSRVAALVRKVGPAPEGTYSIRLQTSRRPYRLTIELEHLDKPVAQTDFSQPSTLLLGLIANLDEVSISSAGHGDTLTAAAASKVLGYEVKDLGRSQDRLTAYVAAQQD